MTVITETPGINGVDTATLFATLDAVKAQPEIAKFQFRACNTWISGTHSRSNVRRLLRGDPGDGAQVRHRRRRRPPGRAHRRGPGPTPVEYLLHGIAACLTAGLANIAAARGVQLHKVTSTVEGDIDLLGILGLSDGAVRNGYEQIQVTMHVEGDADDETLRESRRAVAAPLGRLRRPHQRHRRRHRRRDRLIPPGPG